MATDYSFHDGGRLRRGVPLPLMAMDTAPPPRARVQAFAPPKRSSPFAFDAPDPIPNTKANSMPTSPNVRQLVALCREKGVSDEEIVDALMPGQSDDPDADPAPTAPAMDHRGRRVPSRMPMTPAQRASLLERFPNYNRLDGMGGARPAQDTAAAPRDARFPNASRLAR